MAYGKQMLITDTDAHDFISELEQTVEYVEVIEDNTTFSVYTLASANNTKLEEGAGSGDKLADDTTAGNRFAWSKGQVIRFPCAALTLATGAVVVYTRPTEV